MKHLKKLLDPENENRYQNGLSDKIWQIRFKDNIKDKYSIVLPEKSYFVCVKSRDNYDPLEDHATKEQIETIEEFFTSNRDVKSFVNLRSLKEWVSSFKSLIEVNSVVVGIIGEHKINVVILEKVLSLFDDEVICIYPPDNLYSENPFVFEGLNWKAVIAPIYKNSDLKISGDIFPLLKDHSNRTLEDVYKSGEVISTPFKTPETIWMKYFGRN